MPAASNFSSVKLPADLVQQAREAAQPLRRSTAGQIEYWATLGRVVEHSGLSVQEAQTAIETYEASVRAARRAQPASLDALKQRVLAVSTDGSLQEAITHIVEQNRQNAGGKSAA